ncbi:MAG: hypothetical protein R3313_05240 [Candidatus Saccharimonadales bacterium]|nr:hypothetical protein [Candidatus Saccharimonadales bacterium]
MRLLDYLVLVTIGAVVCAITLTLPYLWRDMAGSFVGWVAIAGFLLALAVFLVAGWSLLSFLLKTESKMKEEL